MMMVEMFTGYFIKKKMEKYLYIKHLKITCNMSSILKTQNHHEHLKILSRK